MHDECERVHHGKDIGKERRMHRRGDGSLRHGESSQDGLLQRRGKSFRGKEHDKEVVAGQGRRWKRYKLRVFFDSRKAVPVGWGGFSFFPSNVGERRASSLFEKL